MSAYTETDLVTTIGQLAGADLSDLTQPQLDGIDQFHSGGAEAVDRLIPSLDLSAGMTLLDVGSGLGGPARQIARTTGCDVVGVDLTEAYVEAATALTSAARLGDRVQFLHSDITRLQRSDFDATLLMHVQMNVDDKSAFFGEIAKRLRPGARLVVFEVCRASEDAPPLPLPWSIDGTDSFLAAPSDLLTVIEESGFTTLEWVDETPWVLEWFDKLGSRLAAAETEASLPALLADGPTRMINFAVALADGTLTVHRGAFRLAD
jgi:sarcosine/dimethylglycine N-methyltransferase